MKPPKNEPYRRSRHRAALHAWVVAATAVASIGIPAHASQRDQLDPLVYHNDEATADHAHRVATQYIQALQAGDAAAAWAMTRLPADSANQRALRGELIAMSDMLASPSSRIEPIAHRRIGHWALSAWRLDDLDVSLAPLHESVTLYNPGADALFERTEGWRVVPQGMADDSAIAPLYDTDRDTLIDWSRTL
ncbi:MAG: hypothetical protein ACPGYV_07710 [Phycisphaeraceae bacterium]